MRQSGLMSRCGRQVALSRKELGTEPWGGGENVVVGVGGWVRLLRGKEDRVRGGGPLA